MSPEETPHTTCQAQRPQLALLLGDKEGRGDGSMWQVERGGGGGCSCLGRCLTPGTEPKGPCQWRCQLAGCAPTHMRINLHPRMSYARVGSMLVSKPVEICT